LPAVDVIAEHDDLIERKLRMEPRHLLADVVLLGVAGTRVADDAELQRARRVGKGDLLGRHAPQRRDHEQNGRHEPAGTPSLADFHSDVQNTHAFLYTGTGRPSWLRAPRKPGTA
jgi:hypothetical protein